MARTWTEARADCRDIRTGYDLVVIEDSEENQFLNNQIQSRYDDEDFWIGLKENGTARQYEWVDTSPLGFGNTLKGDPWSDKEPNSVLTYFIKSG